MEDPVQIVSVNDGKKLFKREFCDKLFYQKSTMQLHITSVHEGKNHSDVKYVKSG